MFGWLRVAETLYDPFGEDDQVLATRPVSDDGQGCDSSYLYLACMETCWH